MSDEIIIPLANGGSIRCGQGIDHEWGGSLRICDQIGNEILMWECCEWESAAEEVIGAVFSASTKTIQELTQDRTLVDGIWIKN